MWFRMFRESFMFAFGSVAANKLRTFLTLFGITIGILSIISVFTVFDWMEKSIKDSIATLGDNTIYVEKWPWTPDANIKWWDMMKWQPPSLDDYEAIVKRSSTAEAVCYTIGASEAIKYRGNLASDTYILAATHDFENIRSFEIERGRYFSLSESASGKPGAIIGYEVADQLFGTVQPIGREITIDKYKAQVIGVFKKEGKGGISDNGMDQVVLVPLNFSRHFINFRNPFLN
ncbi:MAG: ABC transporter permease, partial [Bacteroidota bacterium]|nr:ABC transporter permease [Bacteroidota bacterium]